MLSVRQVSELTGVSVRTLHYYDEIGLLKPTEISDSGYRLYDDAAIDRLQQILLFRELEFPLKSIKQIMDSTSYNRQEALERQIELLMLKKEHLENVITFAQGIKMLGVRAVDFSVFDTRKLDEYTQRAREQWENSKEFTEFEQKSLTRTADDELRLQEELMTLFAEFGSLKSLSPESAKVQEQVRKLQEFISENFYDCKKEHLSVLAKMYSSDGEFKQNIDNAGGVGTAEFVAAAVDVFVG